MCMFYSKLEDKGVRNVAGSSVLVLKVHGNCNFYFTSKCLLVFVIYRLFYFQVSLPIDTYTTTGLGYYS